ncbi:MAG: pilin [Candidatus Magasanikbacteria bacterium]|nr:pilin [Candidatus Magasanikbacteria bacterium]
MSLKKLLLGASLGMMVLSLAMPTAPALADNKFCFCGTDLKKFPETGDLNDSQKYNSWCFPNQIPEEKCTATIYKAEARAQAQLVKCDVFTTQQQCKQAETDWNTAFTILYNSRQNEVFKNTMQGSGGRALPDCVLKDDLTEDCRDITVLVALVVNYGRVSLGIIGAFALCFFIYGGFILIMSSGNPEKVKKGTDTMLAALIGLFIAFVAYLFIRFLGTAIGIKEQFRLF